jgi:hypothetical protein
MADVTNLILPPNAAERLLENQQAAAIRKQFVISLAFDIYARRVNIANVPGEKEYTTLAQRSLIAAQTFLETSETI